MVRWPWIWPTAAAWVSKGVSVRCLGLHICRRVGMRHADVASAATGRREQLGAGGGRPALGRKAKEGHSVQCYGAPGSGCRNGGCSQRYLRTARRVEAWRGRRMLCGARDGWRQELVRTGGRRWGMDGEDEIAMARRRDGQWGESGTAGAVRRRWESTLPGWAIVMSPFGERQSWPWAAITVPSLPSALLLPLQPAPSPSTSTPDVFLLPPGPRSPCPPRPR